MVGSSKVLTVSYGTFSCTLEGFDDSFDTMKSIAEYFRDLAADDRYFGAEPPTPDAEMLARIAEREISRRVEARMGEGGIHLRAADATMPRPQVAAASARAVVTQEMPAAPTMPPAPVVDEPVAKSRPTLQNPESVAAKLQRIRAVVGKTAVQPAEFIEDLTPQQTFAQEDEIENLTYDFATPHEAASIAAHSDETPVPDEAIEDILLLAEEETAAENWSDPEEVDALTEDEALDTAEDFADIDEDTFESSQIADDALLAKLSADLGEDVDEQRDEASEENLSVETDQDLDEVEEDVQNELVAASIPDDTTSVDAPPKDLRSIARDRVRVIRLKRESEEMERAQTEAAVEDSIFAEPDTFEVPETEALSSPQKMSLADLDGLDEFDVEHDVLSAEEEAELLRELSALEDEDEFTPAGQDHEYEDDFEEEQSEAPLSPVRRLGRALLDRAPEQDADLSRIADRADEHLREPESNRRRAAFTQLKAAVAATEAARQLGEQDETETARENPFRRVLDQVVKPSAMKLEQDERPRPAPLKLVASQRVDIEPVSEPVQPQPARAIMPRRIAVQSNALRKTDIENEDGSFAQFAAEHGAETIAELLEAAAAHTTFVEGLEDFSRPQVMRKIMEVETFDREDGMRAFGTLLREGRLVKVRNGRFAVPETSDYRP